MEKSYQNYFAYTIIKRQGTGTGSLRVFDWRDTADPSAPCLTLFIEIETSDKENEKIIATLAEVLSDQFFNAPTETVEFAFESALAKANIAIKDTLLIKPKNWLNKIHILVVAGRDQELHLSSVGRAHAFLVHRGQIMDVVASADGTIRTPNPVKLFSNIVSGRLLGQDALVVSNEAVLDYLSPERIRKTAQDFDPAAATAKFNELLATAPTNKQFALVIIKRLALPVRSPAASPSAASVKIEETVLAKRPELQSSRLNNRQLIIDKSLARASALGKTTLSITSRYAQIGLSATLSGVSKSLEIIQGKLTAAGPRLAKTPRLAVTLWRDNEARHYHLRRFKTNWQKKLLNTKTYISNLSPKQSRILLTTLVLALIFMASIIWRAYGKSSAANKAAYQSNMNSATQKIDQAEASLIYRDEARSRQLLNEINALLPALPQGSSEERARYEEFKTSAANIQNTLDKKQILGSLTPWLTAPAGQNDNTGFAKLGTDYYFYNAPARQIAKIDFSAPALADLTTLTTIRPFKEVVAYGSNNLALIGDTTFDLLNVKTGDITNKDLAAGPADSRAWFSYAKNLYVLAPRSGTIIRYRENELSSPQPWLKETVDLSTAADMAVDGQIYVLTDSAIAVLASGRASANVNLSLSEKLGTNARFILDPNINSLFILDGDHERVLHLSKKGDLYNQYISADFLGAKSLLVDSEEKFVYVLNGDKIFRVAILPPA